MVPLVALCSVLSYSGQARVPIIATGWDSPNTRQFRDGLAAFERWGVFDGTTLRAMRRTSEGDKSAIYAFSRDRWEWSEFAGALADLRASRPTSCRHNYLMLYSNPGDVDWFDDAGWAAVVEHWRLLARLAKRGGLSGLLFDAEPYQPPHSQFLYRAQSGRDRHSFDEYRVMARRRGREAMRAVAAEFPDIVIFSYRLFSDMLGLLDAGDLARALEPHTYGLLPAFVDGWLDVAPSRLRVVEGAEDMGYRANSQAAYDAAYTRLRLRLADFVAPEHREKVGRQFAIGQSLYLDAHVNPPGNPWHIDRTGSSSAGRLAANVASALAASDGLVWLYGERARWWNAGDPSLPTWPDKLPGAIEAVRRAKDPTGFARDHVSRASTGASQLTNGGFDGPAAPGALPTGWWQWQDDGSHGKISTVAGAVELRGASHAVVGQIVPVGPGRAYAVSVRVKASGRGTADVSIGWKTAQGAWTASPSNRRFAAAGQAGADGWRQIVGLVTVPAEAGQIVFMAAATAQIGESDVCWFDDAVLLEVPE